MTVPDVYPSLSEELADLAEMVAAFSVGRLAGPAARAEESDVLPANLPAALAAQGLWTLGMSEQYGGGADLLALAVATERLAAVTSAAAVAVAWVHSAVFAVADEAASPVADVAAAGRLPVLIDTADPLVSVRVTRCGDSWSVDGTAARVEGAGDAALFVLTDPGVGALLVEPSSPGWAVQEPMGRTGLRGLVPHPVTFGRLRLPGAAAVPANRERARITRFLLLGAVACGIAESAWAAARDYTGVRKQFGRLLIEFPAVAEMLGSMAAELADRFDGLTRAAGALRRTSGAARDTGRVAKSCAKSAVRIADYAIQLHGGYGYLAEYPVERTLRDAVTVRALVAAATARSADGSA